MTIDKALLDDIWAVIGPQQNRTKCPFHRVENLFEKCSDVIEKGIEGDFLEAGVWKGGCSALMGKLCEVENKARKIWSLDSFEGMSEPNLDFDLYEGETKPFLCTQPAAQLRNFNFSDFKHTCFDLMGLSTDTVRIVPGWVDQTIKDVNPDRLSILRVDIDFYEPTKIILEALYHKVTTGGYVICDDYGAWKGARKAIDDFRKVHNITSEMQQTFKSSDLKVGTEWWWQVE